MMDVRSLLQERWIGVHRYAILELWQPDLDEALKRFGLTCTPADLRGVTEPDARAVLAALLWRDMAHKSENMPRERAEQLARQYIESHWHDDSAGYTNGQWEEYYESSGFCWSPGTPATFDGGIVIATGSEYSCIWFEDED